MKTYSRTRSVLQGLNIGEKDYWIRRRLIPIGSLEPYFTYDMDSEGRAKIPKHEIVTIPFDSVMTNDNERTAMNILLLGGSGDGKSLIMKLIWSFLHDAGYRCVYVDPYKLTAGYARTKWQDRNTQRIPPNTEPKGIPLQHFVPLWATRNFESYMHHFRIYSTRLQRIYSNEMWQSLGMTPKGAMTVSKFLQQNSEAGVKDLKRQLDISEEINPNMLRSMHNILDNIEILGLVDERYPELDVISELNRGYSVVISYNGQNAHYRTFDIGQKVLDTFNYKRFHTKSSRDGREANPIMWFFDDATLYAKTLKEVNYNYALEQILNIVLNSRGIGVYNCLATQSLSALDETAAENYKIKIISPKYSSPGGLGTTLNVPREAVDMIRDNELITDTKQNLMEFLLVFEDNSITPFFPFTPLANHFRDIYQPRDY